MGVIQEKGGRDFRRGSIPGRTVRYALKRSVGPGPSIRSRGPLVMVRRSAPAIRWSWSVDLLPRSDDGPRWSRWSRWSLVWPAGPLHVSRSLVWSAGPLHGSRSLVWSAGPLHGPRSLVWSAGPWHGPWFFWSGPVQIQVLRMRVTVLRCEAPAMSNSCFSKLLEILKNF